MKILSGGQTGVDRAALDAAIEKGLAYGGWCPKGGWAEDLPDPPGLLALYPHLRETPLADPAQRTEWNVRDAGRLMILVDRAGIGVSKGTEPPATLPELGKPCIVLDLDTGARSEQARAFLGEARAVLPLHRRSARKRGARHLRQGPRLSARASLKFHAPASLQPPPRGKSLPSGLTRGSARIARRVGGGAEAQTPPKASRLTPHHERENALVCSPQGESGI